MNFNYQTTKSIEKIISSPYIKEKQNNKDITKDYILQREIIKLKRELLEKETQLNKKLKSCEQSIVLLLEQNSKLINEINILKNNTYTLKNEIEVDNKSDTTAAKIYRNKMLLCILSIIGLTGLSRASDLKETDEIRKLYKTKSKKFNQAVFSKNMQFLIDMQVIEKEQINTGRQGGLEYIYNLTDSGEDIYESIYNKKPMESEKFKIYREFQSLAHGYFAKTVIKECKEKGYDIKEHSSDFTKEENQLKLEADFVASKGNTQYFMKCEMGKTSYNDMYNKINEMMKVTKTISFILPNREILDITVDKIDEYLKMSLNKNLTGYSFRLATLDMIKKGDLWQTKGPF